LNKQHQADPRAGGKLSRKIRGGLFLLLLPLILKSSGLCEEVTSAPVLPDSAVSSESSEDDSLSALSPLTPEPIDFGADVINALAASPLGPVTDPNVDSVPPLDEPEMEAVEVPKEAENRLWRIRPYLKTGVTYDDNIFITNTNRTADIIYNVDGGFSFELGDYRDLYNNYLLLEYLASAFFFSNHSAQNSLDQSYSLLAQYRVTQLAIQLESKFQSLNGADRQVGAFTTRMLFFNALRFVYTHSEKTNIEFEINQSTSQYPEALSSYTTEAHLAFDYEILPKLRIGPEAVLGVNQVQDSPNRVYQTLNARVDYQIAEKLKLKSSGGIQLNEYTSGGEPMRLLPVFSVGFEYQILPKTSLSLNAYRNLQGSPSLAGQDYIATGAQLGLKQQFNQKISLGLAGGYENDTYVANMESVQASRVDNFCFIRPEISYSFMKYLNANFSYEYRSNASTLQQDSWFDNQVNLELSLNF
jgi:hypothetical protein